MLKNQILAAFLLFCFVPWSFADGRDRYSYFDRAAKTLENRGDADGAAILREFGRGDAFVPRILSESACSSHPGQAAQYSALQKDLKRLIIGHNYSTENAWRIYRAEAALDLVSYELEQLKDANERDVATYISDAQWMLSGMTRGLPPIGMSVTEPEPERDTVVIIPVTVPPRIPEPSPTPRVSLTLSSPRIVSGGGAWLKWNARDAIEVELDGERVDSVGIHLVHPTENHRYQIIARGVDNKIASAVTQLTVLPAPPPPPPAPVTPKPSITDSVQQIMLEGLPETSSITGLLREPPAGTVFNHQGRSAVMPIENPPLPATATPFSSSRFTIPSTAQPPDAASIRSIETLVDALRHNPLSKVRIEGHTDAHGSAASNLKLSRQRATALRNFIVRKYGISARRFAIVGKGESESIAPDQFSDGRDNPDGRRQNRRLEIILIQ